MKLTEQIREMEGELRDLRDRINSDEIIDEPVISSYLLRLNQHYLQEDRSQGKRFTRVEMARMVMEKNQYKEKFLELQETVKFTELKRVKKQEEETAQRRNRSIWGL